MRKTTTCIAATIITGLFAGAPDLAHACSQNFTHQQEEALKLWQNRQIEDSVLDRIAASFYEEIKSDLLIPDHDILEKAVSAKAKSFFERSDILKSGSASFADTYYLGTRIQRIAKDNKSLLSAHWKQNKHFDLHLVLAVSTARQSIASLADQAFKIRHNVPELMRC